MDIGSFCSNPFVQTFLPMICNCIIPGSGILVSAALSVASEASSCSDGDSGNSFAPFGADGQLPSSPCSPDDYFGNMNVVGLISGYCR